jgi:hypothetical protein
MIKYLLLTSLLFSQDPSTTVREWRQALEAKERHTPKKAMFTLVAQYGDGTPAHGYINCDGGWCKHGGGVPDAKEQEPEACAPNMPFKTDARGACVFNPPYYWLESAGGDDEDRPGPFTCYAQAGLRAGKLTFYPSDGGTYIITIPGSRP